MKRVPSEELNPVSELPPTTSFTENAESVPLGVFCASVSAGARFCKTSLLARTKFGRDRANACKLG